MNPQDYFIICAILW